MNRTDVSVNGENSSQRPEQAKYFKYMALVDQFNTLKWDQSTIAQESYFRVKDVAFTSIFAAGCDRMANFLDSAAFQNSELKLELDESLSTTIEHLKAWSTQSRVGLASTFSSKLQGFLNQDCRQSSAVSADIKPIEVDSISKFMPLLAKAATHDQVKVFLNDLANPASYGTAFPAPTTPLNAKDGNGESLFELERYWRGPTWPITNLLLIEGLKNYVGEIPECQHTIDRLTQTIVDRVTTIGLQEYYHPVELKSQDEPIGFGNFSWTAAIYLYLTRARGHLNPTPVLLKNMSVEAL